MTRSAAQHGTMVLRHTSDVPVARLYAAFADPLELARLGQSGGETVLVLDEADFRVGSGDRYRLGAKFCPRLTGRTLYHVIVPERRIVATDVTSDGETCLAVVVTTLEFMLSGVETHLKLTAQLVTLADTADVCTRHEVLMANLDRYLGLPARPPRRSLRIGS